MEKAKLMWRVHGCFWIPDMHVQSVVSGPADNIYEALGAAKSCYAMNFPKLDTWTIFIDFVEAGDTASEEELRKGWNLIPVSEV